VIDRERKIEVMQKNTGLIIVGVLILVVILLLRSCLSEV